VDAKEEIRRAAETGKVVFGSRQTLRLLKLGKGKLVIVASNCPSEFREAAEYYCKLTGIRLYVFPGSSVELGVVVGKPYPVSLMTVLDPGDSRVLSLS
jgi:large subunit ribosomal protein L30e